MEGGDCTGNDCIYTTVYIYGDSIRKEDDPSIMACCVPPCNHMQLIMLTNSKGKNLTHLWTVKS